MLSSIWPLTVLATSFEDNRFCDVGCSCLSAVYAFVGDLRRATYGLCPHAALLDPFATVELRISRWGLWGAQSPSRDYKLARLVAMPFDLNGIDSWSRFCGVCLAVQKRFETSNSGP